MNDKAHTDHGMGGRELRLLAVFRLEDSPDADKELLIALLRVLTCHRTLSMQTLVKQTKKRVLRAAMNACRGKIKTQYMIKRSRKLT